VLQSHGGHVRRSRHVLPLLPRPRRSLPLHPLPPATPTLAPQCEPTAIATTSVQARPRRRGHRSEPTASTGVVRSWGGGHVGRYRGKRRRGDHAGTRASPCSAPWSTCRARSIRRHISPEDWETFFLYTIQRRRSQHAHTLIHMNTRTQTLAPLKDWAPADLTPRRRRERRLPLNT
jgi:hypothetical protein